MRHENSTQFPGFIFKPSPQAPLTPTKLPDSFLQQKSFKQIGEVFEKFIPRSLLKPEKEGAMSRRRLPHQADIVLKSFS
jgi:hypothetical protein